jgi:hypothetical protein
MPHCDIFAKVTQCGIFVPAASLPQTSSQIETRLKGVKLMSKVAVLIRNPDQQYEGLRSSLGMLLYNTDVQMFVLNDEIADMDEAYEDNMGFLDEMEGERFSNNKTNVEKYGFQYATVEQIGEMLRAADLVIPF